MPKARAARTRCRSSRSTPPRASNGRWSSSPAGRRKSSPPAARSTKAAPRASRKNAASPMSASPAPASAPTSPSPPTARSTAAGPACCPRRFVDELPPPARRCRQRDRLRLPRRAVLRIGSTTSPAGTPQRRGSCPTGGTAAASTTSRTPSFRGGYDTPGWKRAQAAACRAATTRPPDIEGRAFRAEDSDGRPLARGRTPGDMLASSDPAAAGGLQLGAPHLPRQVRLRPHHRHRRRQAHRRFREGGDEEGGRELREAGLRPGAATTLAASLSFFRTASYRSNRATPRHSSPP